jgi:hypothetical protein
MQIPSAATLKRFLHQVAAPRLEAYEHDVASVDFPDGFAALDWTHKVTK